MIRWIPNMITCGNLFLGCIAGVKIFEGEYFIGVVLMMLAGILDFLDGFAARALKVKTPLGSSLDSLADLISFGFVPGLAYYVLFEDGGWGEWSVLAFLFTIFASIRLARYSSAVEKIYFRGLPTPAAAAFVFGLLLIKTGDQLFWIQFIESPWILVGTLFILSFLMVSNRPFFSLKMTHFTFNGNEVQWLFLAACAILIYFLEHVAFSLGIILYITFSLILPVIQKVQKK